MAQAPSLALSVLAPDTNATTVGAFFRAYPQQIVDAVVTRMRQGLDNQLLTLVREATPIGPIGVREYYPLARQLHGLSVRENWDVFIEKLSEQDERQRVARQVAATATSQASGIANPPTSWAQLFSKGQSPLQGKEIVIGGIATRHPGGILLVGGTSSSWMIRPHYRNPETGKVPDFLILSGKVNEQALASARIGRKLGRRTTPRYGEQRTTAARKYEARLGRYRETFSSFYEAEKERIRETLKAARLGIHQERRGHVAAAAAIRGIAERHAIRQLTEGGAYQSEQELLQAIREERRDLLRNPLSLLAQELTVVRTAQQRAREYEAEIHQRTAEANKLPIRRSAFRRGQQPHAEFVALLQEILARRMDTAIAQALAALNTKGTTGASPRASLWVWILGQAEKGQP